MATVITQTITPIAIKIDGVDPSIVLVAHRMCESYLGQEVPLSRLQVTYGEHTGTQAIPAVEGYPINEVVSVVTSDFSYLYNDKYIYPQEAITNPTFEVVYLGGIEAQVYDAIRRQSLILKTRPNVAPEIEEPGVTNFNPKLNPLFRTGLASDIKHQLFSSKSKIVGF